MSENEKTNLLMFFLSVIGYGSTALGVAMAYSAWYVGYEFGVPLGIGVSVFGIVVLVVWYMMKKKGEGGS